MRRGTGLGLLVVLLIFLVFLEPLPVHAASTLVQQKEGDCAPCTTLPVTFSSNVASGNVLVVTLLVDPTLTSITDSLSSSFTQAATFPCDGGSTICYIYYATLASSGSDTITITIPGTHIVIEAYAYEVSGVATPPIVTAVSSGASSFPSPTSVSTASTTFQSGAFVLSTIIAGSPVTAGSSFTLSPSGTSLFLFEEYSTSAVTSPTTFPATYTSEFSWFEIGLVLNPAPTPPIPEYPFGLLILAILMLIGYGVIRRRTRNDYT